MIPALIQRLARVCAPPKHKPYLPIDRAGPAERLDELVNVVVVQPARVRDLVNAGHCREVICRNLDPSSLVRCHPEIQVDCRLIEAAASGLRIFFIWFRATQAAGYWLKACIEGLSIDGEVLNI